MLALRTDGRDRTFIYHPQHNVKKHLGVIFVFPVMYLTKRELGKLIPRKMKAKFTVTEGRQRRTTTSGEGESELGEERDCSMQAASYNLEPPLRDSVMVRIWSTAGT